MNPNPNFIDDVAIMSGKIKTFRSLSNGTVRMMVEVDPPYREVALHWFNETDSTVALARLKPETLPENIEHPSK